MYRGLGRALISSFGYPYEFEVCIPVGKRRESTCTFTSSKGVGVKSDYSVDGGRGYDEDLRGRRYAQIQIVDALRFGERERASRLLNSLVNELNHLREDDFFIILDYCARSPDPLFVMEAMKAMEGGGIVLSKACYSFFTQALAKGGYLKEAFNWLTCLGQDLSTTPDLPMYNRFLNGCASPRSPKDADRCLKLMEDRSIGKSEVTYWELLKLAVWQQNLYAVHEIWKVCMEFYSPTIVCLRKFIWSFTSLGDLESAYEALQQMVSVAFKNRSLVKISSGGQFQSSNLDIPIPLQKELRSNIRIEGSSDKNDKVINGHGSVDLLVDVMMERRFEGLGTESTRFQAHTSPAGKKKSSSDCGLIEKKIKHRGFNSSINQRVPATAMKILRWSFNDVIHACAHSQNHELAELLFQQMQSFGLTPSQHTYDGLVKAVVQVHGASYGLDVGNKESEFEALQCNACNTLHRLLQNFRSGFS